ncbi:transcription factor bHLH130 [Cucumis sativus]|uniref:BHLH domain-containing protein n=1 Tax=Cucumis sativus TaxID=3659 RepID=A0A0A0LH01_CUCSA|nr:transcription factor bHLH130 [Cucumis sativus]KGN59326.1 hypothetical protein Csa_002059 [Cucumis sativus]
MGTNTHQSFQQPNSALLRFRSAPSSLFADFSHGIDSKRLNPFEGSESERLVSRFGSRADGCNSNDSESPVAGNYSSGLPPHYPRLSSAVNCSSSSSSSSCSSSSSSMCSSLGFLGSNLVRQSSSPAGVLSQLNQNGYGGGSFSRLSGNNNGVEVVSPSSNRLNSQISFSSLVPSSLGMFPQISEQVVGNEKLSNSNNGETQFFTPSGFPFASWNESSQFSETFPGIKRDPDSNKKFSSGHQNGEIGNRVHLLSHHLSLPKNVSDVASIEKLLQLQDAVPCRIRAKRGCATHPRSIAERVRRTRISERMRKLQDLVPNMDKQTNTADMLDLAVDYIKELQKQFKTLSDNRANCVCVNMQKPLSNQIM